MRKLKNQYYFKKTISILLIIFSSQMLFGYAIEPSIDLDMKDGKIFTLLIHYDQNTDFSLRIDDQADRILWTEDCEGKADFQKKYDLSLLPDGKYFLEVEDANKLREWEILIVGKKMMIDEMKEISIPKFVQSDDIVKIIFDTQKTHKAEIIIVDEEGVELYQEDLENNSVKERVFDFSQVEPRYYFIKTKVGDRDFKFTVNQ